MSDQVRVRYAPSPTGHLHLGGARTALYCYLLARHTQGAFVVRFEDTDQTRHMESGIQSQLEGLKWLGIDWDESVDIGGPYGPYRQMERLQLYQPFIDKLIEEGKAYPCYCSEEELAQEREKQEARGETPLYSGKCRHLTAGQRERHREEGRKASIRFRVPEGLTIAFEDRVRGHVEFESDGIGDFIIVRPDGIPMYNFAVVLDDHMMKISLVIRGEEHLTNTPRQILLYQALGFDIPEFAHISLILNQDRKKMSKRDESIMQFVEQYRDLGYLPEALLNFIALLGWSPGGEEEIFSKAELIANFSVDRLSKSPAVFDTDKLNWMSNLYMKNADLNRVVELAVPHLQKAGYIPEQLDAPLRQWVESLVKLYQEQLSYAAEIVKLTELFFKEEPEFEEESKQILSEEQVPAVLNSFYAGVRDDEDFTPEGIKQLLKHVQKETGFKGKQLFMPIRAAVTGQTHGRDLDQTLYLLGKDKVLRRLSAFVR
ncbi:glutamate--tRNA ligase [Ferviditalea candida]|uniref:Glutamate--tRNA ligase n=1 Tax=Ferviditalea candida TaxID=3108399 RepID=A0ABU5ZQ64_9BACL|nr:glutamate--tRNA ligase [Paenibacillaceae bacterium T2]